MGSLNGCSSSIESINVRPQPHVNLATVTYLFEDEILHRDSLGSLQTIRPGEVNLMVVGKGITHSERERPEVTQVAHRLHGLQFWLALPEADEEIDPAFYHYPNADSPSVEVDGVAIRVIIGSAYGVTSPVKMYANMLYVEWSFVSSRRERIEQAKADWSAQRFPKAIGDEDEFTPLPQ